MVCQQWHMTHTHSDVSAGKRRGLDPERRARAPAVTCHPREVLCALRTGPTQKCVLTPVCVTREQTITA